MPLTVSVDMHSDSLLPLLLVVAGVLFFGGRWREKPWMDWCVGATLALVALRYLHWRFFETVLPVDILSVTGMFVWLIFLVEALAWLDTAVLYAYLLNRADRRPEADAHEARLRQMPAQDLPAIDVFIATFNEPPEVLERTIVGAVGMDWPADRLNVWVLDDGRREWLARMAGELGAGYLTRDGNAHAKAGNINAAVQRTSAPFFLVLDADFIPQRNFLFRTMGFFDDPGIGIVQAPHNFFNPDPMQASLNMSKVIPDDQRFFFEIIMPGRDGYDSAFCCGSNGVVRREALEKIGNKLPSGSITEDMLLTLALKRKGYITRYLNERLAFGLAPENINAFFVQRARWARGAIQILFLREGPFGDKGLAWRDRLFFLPLHWISLSVGQSLAMLTPVIFLLFGISPLANANADTVISYQIPAIVLAIAAIQHFAPGQYHPLATTAHGILQAFRLLPVVLATLVRPHGHAFKVTPKGGDRQSVQDRLTVFVSLSLCGLIAFGLYINSSPNTHIVPNSHLLPVVAAWAMLNMVMLLLVAKIAITPQMLRSEERFELCEPVTIHLADSSFAAESLDVSLSGIRVAAQTLSSHAIATGDWAAVEIAGVGKVPAQVRRIARAANEAPTLSFSFPLSQRDTSATAAGISAGWQSGGILLRRRLIRKLYTTDRTRVFSGEGGWKISLQMLAGIFRDDKSDTAPLAHKPKQQHAPPPLWLRHDANEAEDDLNCVSTRHLTACRQKGSADESAA